MSEDKTTTAPDGTDAPSAGYALRVFVDGQMAPEVPLSVEQGEAFANMLKMVEQDAGLGAMFEQILAQQWLANAQKMFEAGELPIVPKLEDHELEFELVTPD